MTDPARWQQIVDLFDAALDRSAADRADWLAEQNPEPAVLDEVYRLLRAHDRSDGLLERTLGEVAVSASAEASEDGAGLSRRVGPYRLVRMIGRGGMGVVYLAHDPRLDRSVALKFMRPDLRTNPVAAARFLAEAKAASALDHPNICTIFDVGEADDGAVYIAMAFYEGRSVALEIADGPLPIERAVDYARQVAAGLGAAHEAGIVHRDIKPSNLIVTARGVVKIVDFGVAKLEHATVPTQSGARIGTVAYMSPEQTRGEGLDRRTDIWSCGVVLYEMLTGRNPFDAPTAAAILDAIAHRDPVPLETARPEAPAGLRAVVSRALQKPTARRYPRAEDLARDLDAAATVTPSSGGVAAPEPATSLPSPLASFLGRERELEDLKRLLSSARLVTMTGAAGSGKTRLALQRATESAPRFQHGAAFVPLAAVTDPSLVPHAIARQVGVDESPGQIMIDTLRRALRSRQLLLVLDNFEHVVDAAPLVSDLLEACPNLRVLVTSRVVLRISGEQTYPVPPLDVPSEIDPSDAADLTRHSAIALFADRARAANPTFRIDAGNAADVVHICARLEGLPLAIELAAARSRRLEPAALRLRLDHQLDLLTAGPRDRPARHQTLRQAIGWSYDLLDPEEQTFFRRLAVFRGGWTADAARAVAGTETVTVAEGLIDALIDHSLVRTRSPTGDEPRFGMLESLRAYAMERVVQAQESEECTRNHAVYYLAFSETAGRGLTGPEQVAFFDALEAEHDNLRAALAWAVAEGEVATALRMGAALWRFWLARGYLEEGRRWLDQILDLPDPSPLNPFRALALLGTGVITSNQGDNATARRRSEAALRTYRETEDREGLAAALNHLAWIDCEMSDLDTAQALATEAHGLNAELGDTRGIAVALNNLGWIATYRGRFREALSSFERSLGLRIEIHDQRGIAFALINLGWVHHSRGRLDEADEVLADATTRVQQIDDGILTGWVSLHRGLVAHARDDLTTARELFSESRGHWVRSGNLSGIAWATGALGTVLYDLGQPEYREALNQSLETWLRVGSDWGHAWILARIGAVAVGDGALDEARRLLKQSLGMRWHLGDRHGLALTLEFLAGLEVDRGTPHRGLDLLTAGSVYRHRADAQPTPAERRRLAAIRAAIEPGLDSPDSEGPPAMSEDEAAAVVTSTLTS